MRTSCKHCPFIKMTDTCAILYQSSPFSFAHLLSKLGQDSIRKYWSAVTQMTKTSSKWRVNCFPPHSLRVKPFEANSSKINCVVHGKEKTRLCCVKRTMLLHDFQRPPEESKKKKSTWPQLFSYECIFLNIYFLFIYDLFAHFSFISYVSVKSLLCPLPASFDLCIYSHSNSPRFLVYFPLSSFLSTPTNHVDSSSSSSNTPKIIWIVLVLLPTPQKSFG